MNYLFSILLFLVPFLSYSITVEEILKNVKENYSELETLEYENQYTLFKGHKGTVVQSSYKGYVYRNGSQFYQKIDQTEFVYSADFFLQISNKEKAIVLDNAIEIGQLNIDISSILKDVHSSEFVEKSNYYSVTIRFNSHAQTDYSVVKMRVSKKKFELQQLDMYYRAQQNFSTEKGLNDFAQPHLKVTFSKFDKSPELKLDYFKIENYFDIVKAKYIPNSNYSGFEILDYRLN